MQQSHTRSDLALRRLHALGWPVGSAAFAGPSGVAWLVTGQRSLGEDLIRDEGDVRSGSAKRVASAVGEGAMAVKFVHT